MNRTGQYLETQVMTATPSQLYLMVLDGAVRHARRAAEALEQHHREEAFHALSSCRDFVTELMSGLRPEHAPEVTGQLQSMFASICYQLLQADVQQDAARVRRVIDALTIHREAWLEVMAAVSASGETGSTADGGASGHRTSGSGTSGSGTSGSSSSATAEFGGEAPAGETTQGDNPGERTSGPSFARAVQRPGNRSWTV